MDMFSFISNAVIGVLILATLVVVFLTVCRTVSSVRGRKTTVLLSSGVTILAAIGTAQIAFVPPAAKGLSSCLWSTGGALMFAFVTLAVARLLSELLVAAGGMVSSSKIEPSPHKEGDAQAEQDAPSTNEDAPEPKRRGRWSRQSPKSPAQGHRDDLNKKPDSVRQSQGIGVESVPKQAVGKPVI
jgi:hypothetical protein